ncbi:MAG: serine hydrolase [Acidobacteria bacterium]|nr:serine hydrolase [Acidobacteriota bacterium]MBV9478622.1 serine hydrolase [Acidobacteriota bacterium]
MSRLQLLCIPLLLLCAAAVPARAADTPEGHWEGAIELPNQPLVIAVDLETSGGRWRGHIDIPAQDAKGLVLRPVDVVRETVNFGIDGIPGTPMFRGTLAGDKLSGTFTQSGATFPFALHRAAKADPSARLSGFDELANAALHSWNTPGLAVAVVADGKVVYAQGFGKRDVEKALPMTADTLLPIGSVTKSFTTLLMGMLVDEGKLEWDKPVRTYLPDFRVMDETLTSRITPRDLVTHRTGLPRHDLVWYNNDTLTRKEIVARLAHLPASEDFRTHFQYNNLMFLAAGYLVEQLTGQPWEDVARTRIFTPLGMTRSTFTDAAASKDPDHAQPYLEEHDVVREVPFREVGNMGPVGEISSSANELARYALLHLERGRAGDRQLVQPATMLELHAPVIATGDLPPSPEISPASYALGWFIDSYRGHNRVYHGGHIDGFSSLLTLFPADGIAVVTLANLDHAGILDVLTNHIADRMLQLPAIDWNATALAKRNAVKQLDADAETKKNAARKSGTKPSHALADFAGDYESEGYGVLRVAATADGLRATYNRIETPLEHWHYDVFNGLRNEKDPTFEGMKYNFWTDFAGNINAVEASFEPRVAPIVFYKKPDARLSDPAYLAQFLGEYELGPQAITLSLRGNRVIMNIAGQPPYELVPDIDGWLNLKGLTGFRARLSPTTLELSQPNGLYTATRKK